MSRVIKDKIQVASTKIEYDKISNKLVRTPKTLEYVFTILTGEIEIYYETGIVISDIDDFEIGSEANFDEYTISASKTKVTLYFSNKERFEPVLWYLLNNVTNCTVIEDDWLTLFVGTVDKENISPDYLHYTIALNIATNLDINEPLTEEQKELIRTRIGVLQIGGDDIPENYTIPLTGLVQELVRPTGAETINKYTKTFLKYNHYSEQGTIPYSGVADTISTPYYNIFANELYNNDRRKIVQACCNSLASYAVIGKYNKLYILPIYYSGSETNNIITIQLKDFIEPPESSYYYNPFKYIRWNQITGWLVQNSAKAWEPGLWDATNMTQDDIDKISSNEIKELYYPICNVASQEPGTHVMSLNTFHINVATNKAEPLENDSVQFYDNGQYGAIAGLREQCCNYLWDCLYNKDIFKVVLSGTDYDIFNIFKLPYNNNLYKVKQIIYDYVKGVTKITLIKAMVLNRWSEPISIPVGGTPIPAPNTQNYVEIVQHITQRPSGVTYMLQYAFITGSTKVYVNGLRLAQGTDYAEISNTGIQFVNIEINIDDVIIAEYIPA